MDFSSVKSELVEEYQHAINGQQIEFIDNERNNENKNYQCEDCLEEFQAIELYEMHKNIHRPVEKCPTCNRSYKLINRFQEHIESHLNNYLKCTFCPKILFMKKVYTKHISWHKKFEKHYECSFCNKAFSLQKQLTIHERVHTNERPFVCNICNKTFKQNGSLHSHMNTHMEEKKYICHICQGRFATSSSVNRHVKRVHENGVSFSCRLCELEFYNKFSFYEHRKEQHPNLNNYFRTCPVCSEQFNTKRSYLKHKKMHESRGEIHVVRAVRISRNKKNSDKNFRKCVLCGTLVDYKSYYFHLNKHLHMTDDEVKNCERISLFPCKECEYVFPSREKAIRHMGIHLEKSFVCEKKDCDIKTTMTYMSYTVHNSKFHEKFICQLCKVIFVGYAKYKKHRASSCKTKKKKEVFVCKWCKLNFTSSQRLLTHYCHYKKCYSAYQCSACYKSFSLLISLKKHILLSHKSKKVSNHVERGKFKCKHCGDLFDFSNQLIRHERRCLSYMQCEKCNKNFALLKSYILHVENEMCSVDPSKLFCTPCNRKLGTVEAFKKHMKNVHAKSGLQCRYCNQTFKNNESLRQHMIRKHPNNEKYFCKFCKLGFVKFQQLLFHRKSHLGKKNARVEQIAKVQDTS